MPRAGADRERLPKGVEELPRDRGGRRYRAVFRKGKGVQVHLGLYETPWMAGFAHIAAAKALHREAPPLVPPLGSEPTAEEIRVITARVRARLGLDKHRRSAAASPPAVDDLLTFFEITVLGYWRGQACEDHGGSPGEGLDAAAGRVVEAARLLFWDPSLGHPDPVDAMGTLLARRVDRAFGRPSLTRAVLDDDGDEPWRVGRWLVYPDQCPGGRLPGFRQELAALYAELLDPEISFEEGGVPGWASVLQITPPFTAERIRAAYRARSLVVHPDGGGSAEAFVALRAAFEEALKHAAWRSR